MVYEGPRPGLDRVPVGLREGGVAEEVLRGGQEAVGWRGRGGEAYAEAESAIREAYDEVRNTRLHWMPVLRSRRVTRKWVKACETGPV